VTVIAPWNFPLAILTGMTAAALVTGNTVVMKPAEQSSIVGLRLMELFEEAGIPVGVLNLLPGRGEEVGPALVTHPDVSLIAFTGSKAVGLAINIQAAQASAKAGSREIKRVIAELGGKNAILVDDDADLDEAVPGVLASGFGYQGQKCSAASRVIVHEAIYDAFTKRAAEAARSVQVGPPEEPGNTVGPVVDAEARDRVRRYLEIGRRDGRVLAEIDVAALGESGYYVPPTLFVDVPVASPLCQEEVFGPVMAILPAPSFEAAIAMANESLYALTGGVYSRSPAHIQQARREFRVGNLYLNRKITGALVDRQPFGGFRMSGIGSKAGGPDYLLQFVIPRTITESTLRRGFAPGGEAA
jgi:RHH-type proline utilization regulon transcriptional repressor/proline dehydrogenase/delta 1-pyrroline-5-carboxylate dehydrogenase